MNSVLKVFPRLSCLKPHVTPIRQMLGIGASVEHHVQASKRQFTRTLWYMCSSSKDKDVGRKLNAPSSLCCCGCGMQRMHTKGDKELVEFLTEEIAAEKKTVKQGAIPKVLDGFEVELDAAEVKLTKKSADETVVVTFNVNHTVDSDIEDPNVNQQADSTKNPEMTSKPSFEVDIESGSKTLSFSCSFVHEPAPPETEDSYNDIFSIDEVTFYEGEWKDKMYAVAGDIIDGYLYDLLMNMLEERGVTNEFVEKLSDFSTAYEHALYITLLQDLQKFVSGK